MVATTVVAAAAAVLALEAALEATEPALLLRAAAALEAALAAEAATDEAEAATDEAEAARDEAAADAAEEAEAEAEEAEEVRTAPATPVVVAVAKSLADVSNVTQRVVLSTFAASRCGFRAGKPTGTRNSCVGEDTVGVERTTSRDG